MKKATLKKSKTINVSRETFNDLYKKRMFHGLSCISTKVREQYVVEKIKVTAISI